MWLLVIRLFVFLLAVSPQVLFSRGRLAGLGGKAASVCEEFDDNDVGIMG